MAQAGEVVGVGIFGAVDEAKIVAATALESSYAFPLIPMATAVEFLPLAPDKCYIPLARDGSASESL